MAIGPYRLRSGSAHAPSVGACGQRAANRRGPALERARREWRQGLASDGSCRAAPVVPERERSWPSSSPPRGDSAPPLAGGAAAAHPLGTATGCEASSPSAPRSRGELRPGDLVKLADIKSKPELNGLGGALVAFHEEKGRWQVRLQGEQECKLFKDSNLVLVQRGRDPGVFAGAAAMAEAFSKIYQNVPCWLQGGEARSGLGSSEASTRPLRRFLEAFLQAKGVSSMVDAGCGHWPTGYQRFMDWCGVSYTGVDVVPFVLEENRSYFSRPSRLAACGLRSARFLEADLSSAELPAADVLLCKDVLMHLPNDAVAAFLQSFLAASKPRHRFVMLVQNKSELPGVRSMIDIEAGQLLPFDVRDPPFEAPFQEVFSWTSDEKKGVYLWEDPRWKPSAGKAPG